MGARQATIDLLVMREQPPQTVVDSLGKEFSRLTVREYVGCAKSHSYVRCDCSCGKQTIAALRSVTRGAIRSCGCFHSESARAQGQAHASDRTWNWKPLYAIWNGMMQRCYNENVMHYDLYGGRGIGVCERWRGPDGFENFYADMGEFEKGMSIERKDNNLDYSQDNCIWIPRSDQAKNRRYNWCVLMEGEVITAEDAARRLGMSSDYIAAKLRAGRHDKKVVIPIETLLSRKVS